MRDFFKFTFPCGDFLLKSYFNERLLKKNILSI